MTVFLKGNPPLKSPSPYPKFGESRTYNISILKAKKRK